MKTGIFHLAENNALSNCQKEVQFYQYFILMFFVLAIHIELPDSFNREFLLAQANLVGLGSKSVCKDADVFGEGG